MSQRPEPVPPPDAPDADEAGRLAMLRLRLDGIDDAVHDLLMQRAAIVQQVGARKAAGSVRLRPGREAAMLRRLLARHHGDLPRATIVRVWRELLAGTVAMQGAFTIAAAGRDMARAAQAHFGTLAAMEDRADAIGALLAVAHGDSSVAVVPLPGAGARDPWWPVMARGSFVRPLHVVARLPFQGAPGQDPVVQALVVGPSPPDPSGDDVSLLGLTLDQSVSEARLTRHMALAGLTCEQMLLHDELDHRMALVTLAGVIAADDPRMVGLAHVHAVAAVGGYARPLPAAAT